MTSTRAAPARRASAPIAGAVRQTDKANASATTFSDVKSLVCMGLLSQSASATAWPPAEGILPFPEGLVKDVKLVKGVRQNAASGSSDSEHVDQRLKGRRLVTPARVVKEEAVERRAPVLEYPHEPAPRDVFGRVLFQRESQSDAIQRGPERELDVIDDEGPRHGHGDRPAALLELPSIDGAVVPMRYRMQRCAVRSRGVFGFGCESKYAGAARWRRAARP